MPNGSAGYASGSSGPDTLSLSLGSSSAATSLGGGSFFGNMTPMLEIGDVVEGLAPSQPDPVRQKALTDLINFAV
jgi:hypothetical protein